MYRTLASWLAAALLLAACSSAPAPVTGPRPDPDPGPSEPARPALEYVPVSPALPPIPAVRGALDLRVIHPTPQSQRPAVDSTILWGSVGTGGAALEVNGTPVAVAPNGAFIAYLPLPADGVGRLRARAGGSEDTVTIAYAPAAATQGTPPRAETYTPARAGTVTGGTDSVVSGSDAAIGRPTPTGTYRWYLPRGARVAVAERRGAQFRVQLDATTSAWVDTVNVALAPPGALLPGAGTAAPATVRRVELDYEVHVRAAYRPFLVEARDSALVVTVYGASVSELRDTVDPDDFLRGFRLAQSDGNAQVILELSGPVWGYRAWYEPHGDLVVRLRRPPAIDPAEPLRGRRIVVDPGHPPAGTTGPTGLFEGDANLAIALRLAELLRARGAEPILTRTGREGMRSSTSAAVELRARAEFAVASGGELFVSIHNNAFGEGANPFRAHGTMALYFHPFSADLARALDREVVGLTRIPDLGARAQNVAVLRNHWMPSGMTESLFMPIPEQEAALRDPGFLDRLAEAHLRAIESFLRERAADYGFAP